MHWAPVRPALQDQQDRSDLDPNLDPCTDPPLDLPGKASRRGKIVRPKRRRLREPHAGSGDAMRKARARDTAPGRVGVDEILPEYDFSRARPNKHASHYAKGGVVTTLNPDVAAVFPGAREANEALRGLIQRQSGRRLARLGGTEPSLRVPPRRRPKSVKAR